MKDWINKIHCGDALAILKEMPNELVDMVIRSPPYWGLRNYGTEGQIWDDDKNGDIARVKLDRIGKWIQ